MTSVVEDQFWVYKIRNIFFCLKVTKVYRKFRKRLKWRNAEVISKIIYLSQKLKSIYLKIIFFSEYWIGRTNLVLKLF